MGVSSLFNLGKPFQDETMAKIMVIALILLFLVVAFVLSLHLYAKWYLHRSPQPSSTATTLPATTTTVIIRRRRTNTFLRRGLDPAFLKSIPILTFSPTEGEKGTECAVCLSEVTEGEKYRLLPKCHHAFHVDCIDMWFASHRTCPLCRDTLCVPGQVHEPRPEMNLDAVLETVREADALAAFPTNILFWGSQARVLLNSTRTLTNVGEEEATRATSSGMVAIDMPRQSGGVEDDTTRSRSLKRMLSRDRRVNPYGPSGDSTEQ